MDATVSATARPTCQNGTSMSAIRTAMTMGANGGSSEHAVTKGPLGFKQRGVHEQVPRDLEDPDRGDGALDLLLARDEGGDRGIGSGVGDGEQWDAVLAGGHDPVALLGHRDGVILHIPGRGFLPAVHAPGRHDANGRLRRPRRLPRPYVLTTTRGLRFSNTLIVNAARRVS